MNDPDIPASAAIEFRDELLGKNWPDDTSIARLAGIAADVDLGEYFARARTTGTLLGVWCVARDAFLYPDFQFDSSGNLRPDVARLLALLPNENDHGGWQRAFYLYSAHALLEGQLPAEVFVCDPERVISVARAEFRADVNDVW